MNFTKQCDACEHSKVCAYKEDLASAIDTIRDETRHHQASVLAVNITCTEFKERPTERYLRR